MHRPGDPERVEDVDQVDDERFEPVTALGAGRAAVPAQVVHQHVEAALGEGGPEGEVVAGEAVGEQAVDAHDDRRVAVQRDVRGQALDVHVQLTGADPAHGWSRSEATM